MAGRRCSLALFAALTVLGSSGTAWGRLAFGTDEAIREIEPAKDPDYTLCYKISTYFFGAGCYVTDDGYVLRETGDKKSYIPLDAAKIEELQKEGILPNPLPAYSLSTFDYLFGYSNWIILGAILNWYAIKWAWKFGGEEPTEMPSASKPKPA